MTDDWGMEIISGQEYIKGRYVMREYVAKKGQVYYIRLKKNIYIYKESVVYPVVSFTEKKENQLYIDNTELCAVIAYVQDTGMVSL